MVNDGFSSLFLLVQAARRKELLRFDRLIIIYFPKHLLIFFSNLLFFLSPTEWNRIDAPSVMDLVFDEGKIEIEIKRKINNC